MNYIVAISPRAEVTASDFVRCWNATAEFRRIGEAQLSIASPEHYDLAIADTALAILANVALGVATNALYDWVKQAVARAGGRRNLDVRQVDRGNEPPLLVVAPAEEQ